MEYKLYYKKRPVRNLIVIDRDLFTKTFNQVIKFSCFSWGGSDNIIIPSKNGVIDDGWIDICRFLLPDSCIIVSKNKSDKLKLQINKYIGDISFYIWKDTLVNDYLEYGSVHYKTIPLFAHLRHKYQFANINPSIDLFNYNFNKNNKWNLYNSFLLASFGAVSKNLYEYIDDLFGMQIFDLSDTDFESYLKKSEYAIKLISPVILSTYGLRRAQKFTYPGSSLIGAGTNVLNVIVADEANFIDSVCLRWNYNRYFDVKTSFLILPRNSFSSKKKREILNTFIKNNYSGKNIIEAFALNYNTSRARALKTAINKLDNIKCKHVYHRLTSNLFGYKSYLSEGRIDSISVVSRDNIISFNIPSIKNCNEGSNQAWSVDCELKGMGNANGYIVPYRAKYSKDYFGKGIQINADNILSANANRDSNYLTIIERSVKEIYQNTFRDSGYSIKESHLTSKISSIIRLIGSIEHAYIFTEKPFRQLIRKQLKMDNRDTFSIEPIHFVEIIKMYNDHITRGAFLKDMITQKIFSRYVKAECPFCTFKNWFPLNKISEYVFCDGCYEEFLFPIGTIDAHYRLNQLFRESFDNNGVIPILLTLYKLKKLCKESFLYTTGLLIYKDEKVVTDIDIACICDGKMILVECKDFEKAPKDQDLDVSLKQVENLKIIGNKIDCDGIILSSLVDPNSSVHSKLLKWARNHKSRPPINILDGGELISNSYNKLPNDYRGITNINQLVDTSQKPKKYFI